MENLIGPYLVRHAGVLSVPSGAAGPVPVARVLPDSARVRLNSPIVPEPLPIWIEILHSLHRNPVGPRRREYADRRPADLKVRRRPGVGSIEKRGNLRPGQVPRAICVKINVKRRRRSAPCGIFAHHAHSSDVQEHRWWRNIYDEVVSRLVVKCGHRRFELLRADAERRLRSWVVILVPYGAARWKFRRWQSARVAVAVDRRDGKLHRAPDGALLFRSPLCEREWDHADGWQ